MKNITLKNRDKFIEELTDMVVEAEFARRPEDIDIYLYIEENGNWTLKEFENPGGNSYLPDDHFTIWTIKEWTNYDEYFYEIEREIGETIPLEDKIDYVTEKYHEMFEEYLDEILNEILEEHLLGDVEWID